MFDKSTLRKPIAGLQRTHSGKVRDSYELPGNPDFMLSVAGDGVSIFDFVLNGEVKDKGAILTAMTIFWENQIMRPNRVLTDTMAYGAKVASVLDGVRLTRDQLARSLVVRKLQMVPVEAIVRGYLTGSGLGDYNNTAPKHEVCGHALPAGLVDGSRLERSLFTPSTKADVGHDVNISAMSVDRDYGSAFGVLACAVYEMVRSFAVSRGIILADTKFEIGRDEIGRLVLGDERCTPDSSRFWDADDWALALQERRTPKPYDKQFVRQWGRGLGIHLKDPENANDYAWVREQRVPDAILTQTSTLYHQIFERLTGVTLANFQREHMGL